MKSLPFLLLLACLLNTALSHPMFWSFSRQGQYREREISTTSLLDRSLISCHQTFPTRSNTAAGLAHYLDPYTDLLNTALSHSIFLLFSRKAVPTLPNDILLKIASLAAPEAGHFLGNADKALRSASNFYCTPEDIKKINTSRREAKALYQAIVKKDISAFQRLFQEGVKSPSLRHSNEERIYGLELAARYNSPQAAWILLAYGTLETMTNAVEREKLRGDAERRLTETQLVDLAKITARYNPRDRLFLRNLIANAMLGFDTSAPTKQARIFGLQLAIRYGTNTSIFMLLAFGTSDWDMDSKEIKKTFVAAKGKLPQTYLDFLQKIEDSAPAKRNFWRRIVAKNRFLPQGAFVSDHDDTAIVGMQLSLMVGCREVGRELLLQANPDLREKLVHAAAALVTNADESENLQRHWKEIKEHCVHYSIQEP